MKLPCWHIRQRSLMQAIATIIPAVAQAVPLGENVSALEYGPENVLVSECVNDQGWTSAQGGYDCLLVEYLRMCLPNGSAGSGWNPKWGPFSMFGSLSGIPASSSCCACGGGRRIETNFAVPTRQTCVDQPHWSTSRGDTCLDFSRFKLCNSSGGPGQNWRSSEWGDINEQISNVTGESVLDACCACGGGRSSIEHWTTSTTSLTTTTTTVTATTSSVTETSITTTTTSTATTTTATTRTTRTLIMLPSYTRFSTVSAGSGTASSSDSREDTDTSYALLGLVVSAGVVSVLLTITLRKSGSLCDRGANDDDNSRSGSVDLWENEIDKQIVEDSVRATVIGHANEIGPSCGNDSVYDVMARLERYAAATGVSIQNIESPCLAVAMEDSPRGSFRIDNGVSLTNSSTL